MKLVSSLRTILTSNTPTFIPLFRSESIVEAKVEKVSKGKNSKLIWVSWDEYLLTTLTEGRPRNIASE